jgi:3-oxoacyl-[acyl-carrier protein] reductase
MRARFDAEGDVIVVTGGANGIGRALARAAARAGARVVVCDVDAAAMATLSDVAGLSTRRLDVSDRAAVFDVLGEVERHFGKIDGLVCAAAISSACPFMRWSRQPGTVSCGSISTAWSGAIRRWSPA